MYNILICDDDKDIVNALKIYLQNPDYRLFDAFNGVEATELVEKEDIHLILMDIMMPQMDGITAMAKIREKFNMPIILLNAKSEDQAKILGLNIGADDYITKPFNPVTLVAKAKALIRRSRSTSPQGTSNIITAGPFTYNTSTLRFYKNDVEIPLSSKENSMIKLFIDNVDHIFSKDMIYSVIWGETIIDENAIMVYVNRLRQKIEDDPSTPKYLITVRGLGYRFTVGQ